MFSLSFGHTQLFNSHLTTSSPFEKGLGSLDQNFYLSPFLSLPFGSLRNSVKFKFSLTLDNLLLVSGGSLDCINATPRPLYPRE